MSFRTFMGSIGNAFKTGFQNGNLAKGMVALGATASAVGMSGMMIRGMNNSNNGGCGSIFNGYFNGGCCMGMGGMNMFGMNNMYGMYGMSGMNAYMGNMMAYQFGQQTMAQISAQNGYMANGLGGTSTQTTAMTDEQITALRNTIAGRAEGKIGEADAVPSSVSGAAAAFNGAIEAFRTQGSSAEAFKLGDDLDGKDPTKKAEYVSKLSEIAQEHLAAMDARDGIGEDKFITHEIEQIKLGNPNLSQTDEQTLRQQLKAHFVQMDLNGDGKIDWKEMAATIATYDAGGAARTDQLNGSITTQQFTAGQNALNNGTFGTSNLSIYIHLFGTKGS